MILFIASIADAFDAVVIGVGRTDWDGLTLSSDILSAVNADTSFQCLVISFVAETVGFEVRKNAMSIIVSMISEVAFTCNSVEGFILSTSSAGVQNPEIFIFAVALSVSEVSVFTTVLIVTAFAIDHSETGVTDTTFSFFIPISVHGTHVRRSAFSFRVEGKTVLALASSIDVVLVIRADCFTVSSHISESRFAETAVTVAVIVVARVAVGTDSSDFDISGFTDAGLGDGRVLFIVSWTRRNAASLSVFVISLSGSTFGADPIDEVVSLGTVTLSRMEIIDFLRSTADSADSLVNVIELTVRAFSAVVVDKMVAGFANTSVSDPIFVH